MSRAQVNYPCPWLYKVIGCDLVKLQRALLEIVGEDSCDISFSRSSGGGKYHCINLEIIVRSEEERNAIFTALKAHPHVKMVL